MQFESEDEELRNWWIIASRACLQRHHVVTDTTSARLIIQEHRPVNSTAFWNNWNLMEAEKPFARVISYVKLALSVQRPNWINEQTSKESNYALLYFAQIACFLRDLLELLVHILRCYRRDLHTTMAMACNGAYGFSVDSEVRWINKRLERHEAQ